jgi:DNA processing protein
MSTGLPPEAFGAALAGLPAMTPARLRALVRRFAPDEAWQAVLDGHPAARPDPLPAMAGRGQTPADVAVIWRRHATAHPPEQLWQRCEHLGVAVVLLGGEGYPDVLADDLAPPAVLFALGDLGVLEGARCAVVGTRNATGVGREMATTIGAALAANGVRVVSGLAKGIDAAAHLGALAARGAPPVGVVGSGLDVVYPPQHEALWQRVGAEGVLLSEVPPGAPPHAHRFPLRNRIIAALADAVVVVESRVKGGSLHTVREAEQRGVPLLAVPGSPRNPAAEGTNLLLRDGATIVLDPLDVLVALGFQHPARLRLTHDHRPPPEASDKALLDLFAEQTLDVERVAALASISLTAAALGLGRLEAAGWLERCGAWFQRIGPR